MRKIKKYKILTVILIALCVTAPISTQTTINAEDKAPIYVTPGGEPFGIKMFSDGLIVTKLEDFSVNNENICPAEEAGLSVNDIIYSANEKILYSNNELKNAIENSQGEAIKLKVKRNNKFLNIYVTPQKDNEGIYKAGVWVKDSAAGLGTVTFYKEDTNTFCGLGHGICDKNTNKLIPLSYGELDKANISSITKSSSGSVGTLNGYFTDVTIGKALCNHETGIYGYTTQNIVEKDKLIIADKKDVTTGKAYILTTTLGDTPEKYEVEITKVNLHSSTTNLTIKITDKKLIETTGGIVQGMSGSPIIQNGKLIGALTHVLVDNVNYGYGIFAETMYEIMCETC